MELSEHQKMELQKLWSSCVAETCTNDNLKDYKQVLQIQKITNTIYDTVVKKNIGDLSQGTIGI
jgi:hypothetical protein